MSFMCDVPPFYCYVRNRYLYDLESGHDDVTRCLVFAVDSVEGHAIGFDIMTDWGGQFARLPISALCHIETATEQPLYELELWNNFSYSVEALEYGALRNLTVEVRVGRIWSPGTYMFTLSWFGSQYAEQPGDGGFKRAHIIQLANGNYAAQPNNRIKWYEPSFITKPFPEHPDVKTNSHVWNAERRPAPWATEDTDRWQYDDESPKTDKVQDVKAPHRFIGPGFDR